MINRNVHKVCPYIDICLQTAAINRPIKSGNLPM